MRALILSPTRELALQIKEMINAVIPMEHQDTIKTCCLVGGMSVQKQQRLLSYNPAIIIATPGRLWELLDDKQEPYLVNGLPLIDVLVMDEADRMVADGHFKEMHKILDYIYTKRVQFKKQITKGKDVDILDGQQFVKADEETNLKILKNDDKFENQFKVGKNLNKGDLAASIKN